MTTNISLDDFMSAGLEDEGIYRIAIRSMKVEEKIAQTGANAGNPYKVISAQFKLVEKFGDGLIDSPPTVFDRFYLSGRSLERFRKLYVAAMGELPSGEVDPETGEVTVPIESLVDALIGNESVWTTYSWRRPKNDPNDIEGSLGWSFTQDPTKLKAPTPFEQRDKASN